MVEKQRELCPTCNGTRTIPGECVCDMEWRGTRREDGTWDDCQCAPERACPTCHGTGKVEEE